MRRRLVLAAFVAALSFAFLPAATRAKADVTVQVDRVSQTMAVIVDGFPRYTWRISTGRPGYGTPAGVFHPHWMVARWFSRVYDNAPMPHAIFFYGGFAIHGSYAIARLGVPASHGCVRLHPNNAAVLFDLIQREGMHSTTIVVQ
jgi:lipoprotein-anchoring transpeptidase ErfK/SrfK